MLKALLHTKYSQGPASPKQTSRGGFSLVELIISAALILLFATLFANAVLAGEEGASISGMHARATLLAEEGLEAVRNMRDANYANLSDGTYGIGVSGSAWALIGTSDTQDIFTRVVKIQTIDAVTKQASSTVTWSQNGVRTGTVSVATYLTNLDPLPTAKHADTLLVNTGGTVVGGASSVEVQNTLLQNTGSVPITIKNMKISWSPSASKLSQIVINNTVVWSTTGPGSPAAQQSSGATTTIQNTTIAAGDTVTLNKLVYTGNMHNNSFTLVFTMTDNSQKIVTIPTLP